MQNLVYKWVHLKKKILNLSQNCKFQKIWTKSDNFGQNWNDWYINGYLFSLKIGICMNPLSNSQWHISTKNKLEYSLGFIYLEHAFDHLQQMGVVWLMLKILSRRKCNTLNRHVMGIKRWTSYNLYLPYLSARPTVHLNTPPKATSSPNITETK